TQINLDIALNCSPETPCEGSQYLPTMFPELKTPLQMSPSIDDKVTLSWIYPDPNFNSKFCMATGKIVDAAGKPLRGVNVIASRVDDGDSLTRSDARSMVSGVLYPGCLGDSAYYLYGFVPGKKYHVTYEPLAEQYAGHSGFEPLDQPPSGFASGTIEAENGETVIGCEAGNTVIPMKTVTIDVKNTCLFSRQTTNTNTSTAPGSAGGCSFMRLQ
ncbi:MAG: hypothetical protein HY540_06720, partial [Deltaproteobacteria bacterium]|nr:hypothetical protein [Deltaproteobacteria bacterium]